MSIFKILILISALKKFSLTKWLVHRRIVVEKLPLCDFSDFTRTNPYQLNHED